MHYYAYEMAHAFYRRCASACSDLPYPRLALQPDGAAPHSVATSPPPAKCSRTSRAATASRSSASRRRASTASTVPVREEIVAVNAVLPSPALRARRDSADRQAQRPQGADRRADVRPLRHAAARHRRGDDARARRLHHRLDRRARHSRWPWAASISTTSSTTSSSSFAVLGPDTHVIAVCQPAVPVLAATRTMASIDDPCQPASLTLMGGPIDTRRNPTRVNKLAEGKLDRMVRAQRRLARCRSRTPASCAPSIPASCSSPAS